MKLAAAVLTTDGSESLAMVTTGIVIPFSRRRYPPARNESRDGLRDLLQPTTRGTPCPPRTRRLVADEETRGNRLWKIVLDAKRPITEGIIQGGSFDAPLELALEACEFFEVKLESARSQALEMPDIIAGNWKRALRAEGCTSRDVQYYASAFQHEESTRALVP